MVELTEVDKLALQVVVHKLVLWIYMLEQAEVDKLALQVYLVGMAEVEFDELG